MSRASSAAVNSDLFLMAWAAATPALTVNSKAKQAAVAKATLCRRANFWK